MDPLGPLRCPPQVKLGREEGRGHLQRERERRHWLFITLAPKSHYNVFLLVGLTTLGAIVNFDWLIH